MTIREPRARGAARRAALAVATLTAALALSPALAQAQLGGAVGIRDASGDTGNDANGDRRGVEARVMYDGTITNTLGWRIEGAYNQMQFQRTDGALRFQVNENGFEFILAARAEIRAGALTGAYLTAGPVASFRAACGTSSLNDSNGRVACDEGETYLTGYAVGAGVRWMAFPRSDFTLEARYMGNTTAAQGQRLIAVSVGLRRRGARSVED